jgi:hypothetical protein
MEQRLQEALDFTNYRQTLNNQLHKLKIKTEGMLIHAEAGGKFTINQQLICFLDYLVKNGYMHATLLDDNKSPVHIDNTQLFLKIITTKYFEVTNDYLQESLAIKKSRNVKSVIDLKD